MNKSLLIEKALAAGFEQVQIYASSDKTNAINLFMGNVDRFEISESGKILVKGIYQGKMGCVFLEEDQDANIDFCIEQMKSNAQAITSQDEVMLYEGDKNYPTIEKTKSTMQNTTSEQRIAFLKEMEEALKQADARISQVMSCSMRVVQAQVQIVNSKGLNIQKEEEYALFVSELLASENQDQKSSYEYALIYDLDTFDRQGYIERVVHKAVDKLNAIQPQSGKYPVILKNNVMCDLLEAISPIFNGESAYKGTSILKDRLNEMIFDEKITLLDHPLLKDGYSSTPFDDEGVASYVKKVVDHGKLNTYLHNLKSAALMKTQSTGNGFGASISPTNLYFEKGSQDLEEMIESIHKGVLIDSIVGIHAGLNDFTTDFSLQASGFMIEEGKITQPIHLITVAGNFLEMMKQVEGLGSDLHFEISGCGSPSMKFNTLTISGC